MGLVSARGRRFFFWGATFHGCPFARRLLFTNFVAIKVVPPWERVALMRLGRYRGLRGPGLFFIIPVIDTLSPHVDQRVRVASVSAESTLTRDTVPVNVDAIVFWMVWNAEKSILEVENSWRRLC
jgi:regulator of protease activity HflC (stomatin/prohibitin superfamily)